MNRLEEESDEQPVDPNAETHWDGVIPSQYCKACKELLKTQISPEICKQLCERCALTPYCQGHCLDQLT